MRAKAQRSLMSVVLIAVIAACSQQPPALTAGDLAFVNVNVVDVDGGVVVPEQTVVIAGDRIVSISPTSEIRLSEDVKAVNARGRYLAPGIMDMHTHPVIDDDLTLALAHGVTTMRVMWGNPMTLQQRAGVESGQIPGPRIVTAGDLIDGEPAIWAESGLPAKSYVDAAAMDAMVAGEKAAGYDFVKTYSRLTPEVFGAILAAGNKHGMEVSGHVPQSVSLRDAIAAGMRTSEHFIGVMVEVFADESLASPDLSVYDPNALAVVMRVARGDLDPETLIDPQKLDEFAGWVAGQDHWFVPTHDIMRNFTNDFQTRFPEAELYMTAEELGLFDSIESGSFFRLTADQKTGESILYEVRTEVLRTLHEAGAKIMAGTDHGRLAGLLILQEIKALHKAGFSKAAALRAATSEPGRYLGMPGELGVVAEGAMADLILLDANPLEDLDNLGKLQGVMARGTWYDRTKLDEMLGDLSARLSTAKVSS